MKLSIRASGAQYLVLLGDILNHGQETRFTEVTTRQRLLKKLVSYLQRSVAVRGNCDSGGSDAAVFPMMMDYSWVLLESGQRIFLTHGAYNTNKATQH
ncbi:hypothetical protein O9929_09415 [Vibrio lentus]|nr:hypothetical protein [Vibrio lentus]